jgi:site-specific DNA-methyltransferase (adenine-specific)
MSVRDLRKVVREAKATLEIRVQEARVEQPLLPRPLPAPLPQDIRIEVADAGALPLPDDSVDLIVTSPPYGLDKAYSDGDDHAEDVGWRLKMQGWLREMYRVSRDGGRLAINVPLDTTLGGFRPTYAQTVFLADVAGWRYRATIVWNEGNVNKSTARGSMDSAGCPHIIAPVEMVALFSKGDWRRDAPNGGDLDHQEWLDWTNGLWTFGGESRPWEGHPAAFPEELPRRLIKLLSFPGDTVLDPFVGSGTTTLVAYRLGRKAIGFDASAEYVESARRRLVLTE